MHRLQRGAAPTCLAHFDYSKDGWSAVTGYQKREIWTELHAMQRERCAYCEARLRKDKRHIEHFRQRSRVRTVTFDWNNLFGSCNAPDSCGKHKDHRCTPYNDADLIKPDRDDPEDYFIFVSDGTIAVRSSLGAADRQRAEETLRVFNLNAHHGALRARRRQTACGWRQFAVELQELAEAANNEEEWLACVEEELDAVQDHEFITTIRHTLLGARP